MKIPFVFRICTSSLLLPIVSLFLIRSLRIFHSNLFLFGNLGNLILHCYYKFQYSIKELRHKNLISETVAKLPPFLCEKSRNSGFTEGKRYFSCGTNQAVPGALHNHSSWSEFCSVCISLKLPLIPLMSIYLMSCKSVPNLAST